MKKKILFLFILSSLSAAFAQTDSTATEEVKDPNWKKGGHINLNFSNVTLRNWAGGGQSSVSLGSKFNAFANYEKGKTSWNNSLDIAYGLTKIGKSKDKFRKSDDQLIFISKFAHRLSERWLASALVDFRSQVANGYVYSADPDNEGKELETLSSRFMAPAYLLASAGIEYRIQNIFSFFASPLTGKTTFVMDDNLAAGGAYGVDPGQNIRQEYGALVKISFKKELLTNVDFQTDMNFFTAYDESFGAIDVNLIATLNFKINDYLTAMYSINLIYDEDINLMREDGSIGPAVQYKDVLNIGFVYKF